MWYDSLNIGTYNFMFERNIKFYNLSTCRNSGGSELVVLTLKNIKIKGVSISTRHWTKHWTHERPMINLLSPNGIT